LYNSDKLFELCGLVV